MSHLFDHTIDQLQKEMHQRTGSEDMTVDEKLLKTSPAYRGLYMKYLGTLRVLGELASRCDKSEVCMTEEVDACMEDAQEFLRPRVVVAQYEHFGFHLVLDGDKQ